MGIEELEKQISRRKFLAGLGLTVGSVSLAKLALLQTRAEELARRNSPGVETGPGVSPATLETILRAGSPGIGSSAQYLRSDGSRPSWVDPFSTDFDARYATIASLNRRLKFSLTEDFSNSNTTEDGEIGELGWGSQLSSGSLSVAGVQANHPGLINQNATATNGFLHTLWQ